MRNRVFTLITLLTCSLSLSAADQLVMKNGEVLLGEYLQTANGNIEFKSDTFGVVSVPEANATLKIASDAGAVPASEATAGAATAEAKQEEQKPSGWVRNLLNLPDNFKGNIAAGRSEVSGTTDADTTLLKISFGMADEHTEWNAYANYSYGKTNGTRTVDNYTVGGWYKWYFWGDGRWFLHFLDTYHVDRIQLIQSEFDVMLGLGYYFLKLDNYQWQFSVGGNYEDKDYFTSPFPALLNLAPLADIESWKVGIYEQFTAQPLPYINISHTLLYAFDPNDTANYDYLLNLTVSTPITKNTSIGLSYDRSWNSAIPELYQANGIEKDNTTFTLQMGYNF